MSRWSNLHKFSVLQTSIFSMYIPFNMIFYAIPQFMCWWPGFTLNLDLLVLSKGCNQSRSHSKGLTLAITCTFETEDLLAAVAVWLSSWLAEQEDRGSIPGLATWIFRNWLSPASKSRYGWKIAKSTLILKTTNNNQQLFFKLLHANNA